jgi:hypothetical protein
MLKQQFLITEKLKLKAIQILIEVPCFKCLFIEPLRESHLHCNPNECEKLTEWLLLQVERDKKAKEPVDITVAHAERANSTQQSIC